MHAAGPVHRIGESGFHALCTWDAVNEAIGRPEDFSSNLTATMTYENGTVGTFPMGELGGEIQALATADDPQDNLLGDLATARADGELSDLTALNIMATLFSAGGESTASLIGSAAYILASHPDIQRQVREKPDLLGAFLEEVLRYEPPFRGHYRHVVGDTTLSDIDLRAGSRLVLLWSAANRDLSHFPDANDFRLDRPGGKGHISFGKGAHFCVGAALARMEARIVIGELLRRTAHIEAHDIGRWLPSLLVRRVERLDLSVA